MLHCQCPNAVRISKIFFSARAFCLLTESSASQQAVTVGYFRNFTNVLEMLRGNGTHFLQTDVKAIFGRCTQALHETKQIIDIL